MFKSVAITLAGVFVLGSSVAAAALVVVTPDDHQGWGGRASNTGTIGLGVDDMHGGTGSLLLATDGTDGQIVKVARVPTPIITIADVAAVSWEVNTSSDVYYPRPNIEYWSPSLAGTLVYDSGNATPTVGSWVKITVSPTDLFRDTRTNTTETLAYWQSSEIAGVPVNFFQIGFGSTGGTFPAVDGNVDYVELNDTTWDFSDGSTLPPTPGLPSATSVPTLSQWALIVMVLSLGMVAFFRRKHFS